MISESTHVLCTTDRDRRLAIELKLQEDRSYTIPGYGSRIGPSSQNATFGVQKGMFTKQNRELAIVDQLCELGPGRQHRRPTTLRKLIRILTLGQQALARESLDRKTKRYILLQGDIEGFPTGRDR